MIYLIVLFTVFCILAVASLWSFWSEMNGRLISNSWGSFSGSVRLASTPDPYKFAVTEEISYDDPSGFNWVVPAGYVTDGASIPRALWTAIGSPFTGRYLRAAVLHDYQCELRVSPHEKCHRMFFNACMCDGMTLAGAKVLYAAVIVFGPKWSGVDQYEPGTLSSATDECFEKLRGKIAESNPSVSDIEENCHYWV